MNHLEKYLDRIIDQPSLKEQEYDPILTAPSGPPIEAMPVPVEAEDSANGETPLDLLGAFKRRWYIIFLLVVLLAPAAVFGVWYFVLPGHIVAGRLKVAPAVLDIMTGNEDSGSIGNYGQFVATQALTITSTSVILEVAADLADKDLKIFEEGPKDIKKKLNQLLGKESPDLDPEDVLRRAVASGIIAASPRRNTHFIDVRMKSMRPEQATEIVNSFITNYHLLYDVGANREGERNLTMLIQEKDAVYDRITRAKKDIRALAKETGATDVGTDNDLLAGRINTILARVIELESKRIALDTQVSIIKNTMGSDAPLVERRVGERASFIHSDPYVTELTRQVVAIQQQLLVAKEQLATQNPVIKEKEDLLAAFKRELETIVTTRGAEYDLLVSDQAGEEKQRKMEAIQAELALIKAEEDRFKEVLAAEELKLIAQSNGYLEIKDKQFEVDLDMEIYDTLSRRIKQMEMERNRKPRITIVERANRLRYEDKRVKYSAGVTMGIFGLGCLLALLLDRADKRLKDPEDVAAQTNLPLIGTVANARSVKASKFAEQIASDYQTIRTNLALLGPTGMPKLLCITSPGPREGKSSFSVNLATSLAKSGERVLLVDGDMRKPDTLRKMNFAHMTEQVSHVPIEGGADYTIWNVDTTGLDILVPDAGNLGDVYELLASPVMFHRITNLSQKYDRIIIDTPPLLAFPDALIWARIAGSVILMSFSGKTTIDDLVEARERLAQTNAQLLGTILNNVKVSHGYLRYHYGYYNRKNTRRDVRMNLKVLMGAREAQKHETDRTTREKTA